MLPVKAVRNFSRSFAALTKDAKLAKKRKIEFWLTPYYLIFLAPWREIELTQEPRIPLRNFAGCAAYQRAAFASFALNAFTSFTGIKKAAIRPPLNELFLIP